jgi:tetratricopeptide (TPR) repeat protein
MFEWVETYSGEMAETPIQLLHAAQSLQEKVSQSPQIQFINLSKNAAKVEGVSYYDANSIPLTPIDQEFSAILSPDSHRLSTTEKIADLTVCIEELTHANDRVIGLESLLKEAESLTNDICINLNNHKKIRNLSAKLEKIEQHINKKFSAESTLIKFYGYYEFSKFLSTKHSSDWTQLQINQMATTYYQAYLSICRELQRLIDAAIQRTHSRSEELNPNGDICSLLDQWTKDNQVGRSLIWQQRHHDRIPLLSKEETTRLNQAITSYNQRLKGNKCVSNIDAINNIQQAHDKLDILFRNNHLIGISKMIQYLTPHKNSDNSKIRALYSLASSYKSMLEGNDEQAFAEMLSIEPEQRDEVELKHLIKLSLRLNKLDFVLDSFKQIIQYSDEYLPQYAHALKLSGKPQDALNIYLDYLDKYPEDIPVLLKLGIFLAEVGQIDGAKSCFQNVLNLDPNNQAAQSYLQQIGG